MGKCLKRENTYSVRLAKDSFEKIFGRRILWVWTPSRSGVFQDEDAAIIERDFGGFPIDDCGLRIGRRGRRADDVLHTDEFLVCPTVFFAAKMRKIRNKPDGIHFLWFLYLFAAN
jgi:hypothetical protein